MGLTGKEIATKAASYLTDRYCYWYGGKGQKCTEALLNNFSALYPSIYTEGYKKKCREDIAAGKYCIDCSGLVCKAYRISDIGTYQMATDSRFKEWEKTPKNGMIVWRWTHCGIYYNGLVIEARGKNYGITAERKYNAEDWQRVLYMPSVTYDETVKSPVDYVFAAWMTIKGKYGNGEERKSALTVDGYDPEKVQRIINEAYK